LAFTDKLNKMDVMKLKSPTGETYAVELRKAAQYLKDCIQDELDDWYAHFLPDGEPKIYERTYGLKNSMSVDDITEIQIVGNTLSLNINFDGMYHPSLFGDEIVNTLWLMNYGYKVDKVVWFKNIENFGYREGGFFIEKGIAKFNATNPLGFKVTPTYQGQEINENNYDSFRMY
jgi:hypothetical protein